MLSLNLARILTAQERFEFVYEREAFPEKGDLTKPWVFDGKTYTP